MSSPLAEGKRQKMQYRSVIHMIGAERSATRCKAAHDKLVPGSDAATFAQVGVDAALWDSITTVLLAVAAIDAAAMEVFYDAKEWILFGVGRETQQRLADALVAATVPTKALGKMDVALRLLTGREAMVQDFKGRAAWSNASTLIDLRNHFTHTTIGPVTVGATGKELGPELAKLEHGLKGRFPHYIAFPEMQDTFPMNYLGPGLAYWSLKTAIDVIEGYYRCVGATAAITTARQATQSLMGVTRRSASTVPSDPTPEP